MDTSKIKVFIALLIGIPLALWLGVSIAQEQVQTVLWILGAGFLILCVALGRHVWILIPATLGMQGGLNFLPGSPPPWSLMTVTVGFFFVLRIFARKQPLRLRWTGMDTAVLLVALTILQAFMRNPTGLSVLGGGIAGGKPYLVFGVAFVAWVLIGMADADVRSWRWAVMAFIGVSLLDGCLATVSAYSPTVTNALVRVYSNVSYIALSESGYAADVQEMRISQFGQVGGVLCLVASTFWRPLSALDASKPWRGVIAFAGVLLTVLAGFRSILARVLVFFVVGSLLRNKVLDVVVIGAIGILGLALLIVAVPADAMPYSVQRVLTVVPGFKARAGIASEAQGSVDVRVNAWRLALFTDRYISNKLLGDGFQASASELAFAQMLRYNRRLAQSVHTEDQILASGDYHGFHMETVRFTGAVGLLAATIALIAFAVFGMRNIRYFQHRSEWGYVLFVCMPFLIEPLWYWLVFGSYKTGLPVLIAQAGMVKLLTHIRLAESRGAATPISPLDMPVAR